MADHTTVDKYLTDRFNPSVAIRTNEPLTVYLAGPILDADDDGHGWRDDLTQALQETEFAWEEDPTDLVEFVNPLDKYDASAGEQDEMPPEEIVANDLDMIDGCDVVFAYYSGERAFGTPMELFYAADKANMGVVLVWDTDLPESPWMEAVADEVVSSVTTGIRVLDRWRQGSEFEPNLITEFGSDFVYKWEELTGDRQPVDSMATRTASDEPADSVPHNDELPSGDDMAASLLADVAALVGDSRDSHGDAVANQQHIGEAWTWYLNAKYDLDVEIDGADVARLMELLKLSRHCVGAFDIDHDRDTAGYSGIAAACEVANGNADLADLEVFADDG